VSYLKTIPGTHPTNPKEALRRAYESAREQGKAVLAVSRPELIDDERRIGPYWACHVIVMEEGPNPWLQTE